MKQSSIRRASLTNTIVLGLCVLAWWGPMPARSGTNAPAAFGVIADIQYADKDSRAPRKYRQSLQKLSATVEAFNSHPLDFVIELGDLMDGYQNDTNRSLVDLDAVLPLLGKLQAPLYYVLGNHCITGGRDAVMARLKLGKAYYDFTRTAAPGWRFVVLDGTDQGYGVIGQMQKDWMKAVLDQAEKNGERVICFCHFPLLVPPAQGHPTKKATEVVELLTNYPCVTGWFAGHDHRGGYVESNGIHFVTFKGMIEAVSNAYSVVELSTDRIRIEGFGDESSRELKLVPRK
jgi:manganese-dependent ADP-ribose/CDP-alcohol diphosphatase